MIEESLNHSGQRPFFNTFIKPLKLYAVSADTLYISGDTAFNLNHMKQRYGTMLYSTVPVVFGKRYELEYYPESEIAGIVDRQEPSTLNEKYTFDNFITGAPTALPTPRPWPWPRPPARSTTRCSSTAAWAWARPT